MSLGMLQGMGLGMVQRWLGMWVLELKLGFQLVHTGRPIMRKCLFALFLLLGLKKLLLYLLE